jgi:hypothetical protein
VTVNPSSLGKTAFSEPEITGVHLEFGSNGPELVIQGDRFTVNSIETKVNFRNPGANQPVLLGQVTSLNNTEIHVSVPKGTILGLAQVSVSRKVDQKQQTATGFTTVPTELLSNSINLRTQSLSNNQ